MAADGDVETSIKEPWLTNYWGKARPSRDVGPDWHPLAYHSLDVAAAMGAMLDCRPHWLSTQAELGQLDMNETRRRLVLAAALHDLGKFADNFQQKAPHIRQRLQPNTELFNDGRGHGEIGARIWENWMDADGPCLMEGWANAAFAHHGAPVAAEGGIADAASKASISDALNFARAAISLIGEPAGPVVAKPPWLVAGLVILADWIGSNQAWFPYQEPTASLTEYWEQAQYRARIAVAEARLVEAPPAPRLDLQDLIGAMAHPTPVQAWALAQKPQSDAQLYIVEDLTGAGKTEAALVLAHRLMSAGAAEGLYWALPSMATANGLYARLTKSYRALFAQASEDPSLLLVHSARDLDVGFQASIGRERDGAYGSNLDDAQNISAEAFCATFVAEDRKKSFLAPVGVGTIDQALLAVLPVRHQSLRLAALARRVLVIDEAHAYDPYMMAGMERLLSFHAALGGSAIVLSATLTRQQRQRLVRAYSSQCEAAAASQAFPLITHVCSGSLVEAPLDSTNGTRRDLAVRRLANADEAIDRLLQGAAEGACGVYIRNTVKDAVTAYEQIKAKAPPGVQVDLFHARFALGDRITREKAILARFGKASGPLERSGQILVATQVVEQSLDLDFDLMATDLCPMDLLIQRAGRLHRHTGRAERLAPELWVVGPEAVQDASADWYASAFSIGQYVYPDAGQLWRTQALLTATGGLNLASASSRDLIEPVFGDAQMETPAGLDRVSGEAAAKRHGERAMAHLNFLKFKAFHPHNGAWGSDAHTPTRLGEDTVVLRLARWENGRLNPWSDDPDEARAWRLSEISIAARRLSRPLPPSAEAEAAIVNAQASWPGRYEPPMVLALEPSEEDIWTGKWLDRREAVAQISYSLMSGLIAP